MLAFVHGLEVSESSLPMNLSASGSIRSWYRFLASASNLWVLKIRIGWGKGEGRVGSVGGDEGDGGEEIISWIGKWSEVLPFVLLNILKDWMRLGKEERARSNVPPSM